MPRGAMSSIVFTVGPEVTVKQKPQEFQVWRGTILVGTLCIKGNRIGWKSKNQQSPLWKTWDEFEAYMQT